MRQIFNIFVFLPPSWFNKNKEKQVLNLLFAYLFSRCPTDPTVIYHPSPKPEFQRFSLKAFQFVGVKGPFVYIHCKVIVCNSTDPNSQCAKNCEDLDLFSKPARSRHRRSIDYNSPLYSTSFTQGPLLNLDHGRPGISNVSMYIFLVKTFWSYIVFSLYFV